MPDIESLTDRSKIEERAQKEIGVLRSEILRLIYGKENEFFYTVPSFYLNVFEGLSRNGQSSSNNVVKRDPTWYRGTNSFISALEEILPDIIPIYSFNELDAQKLKAIFDEHIFETALKKLTLLGYWIHVLEDINVSCIEIREGSVEPCRKDYLPCYQEYVDKVSNSDEGARVLDYLYSRLFKDINLRNKINATLKSIYGFSIEHLAGSTKFLRSILANDCVNIYPKEDIREIFLSNVPGREGDALFKHFIFQRGKSLRTSPMVPVVKDRLMIIPSILNLGSVFDEILRKAMEQNNLSGEIGNFMGRVAFEDYVSEKLTNIGMKLKRNVEVRVSKYPNIAKFLCKKPEFELDILASTSDKAYVISCKGGKKELPRLSQDQQWAEYPARDIKIRIDENKEHLKEIERIAQCFKGDKKLALDSGIDGFDVIPVVVYASIQPLSIDSIRVNEKVSFKAVIRTTDELCKILTT